MVPIPFARQAGRRTSRRRRQRNRFLGYRGFDRRPAGLTRMLAGRGVSELDFVGVAPCRSAETAAPVLAGGPCGGWRLGAGAARNRRCLTQGLVITDRPAGA
jgi:non-ribosomal peptide synthetase component F